MDFVQEKFKEEKLNKYTTSAFQTNSLHQSSHHSTVILQNKKVEEERRTGHC